MNEREPSSLREIQDTALSYWKASSYQRAIRKLLEDRNRGDLVDNQHYATSVINLKKDHPMAWSVIGAEASKIRRRDMIVKAKTIGDKDPVFWEKAEEERLDIVENALIAEFFELSQKAPVSLRALQSILSSDVEESGRKA